MSLSPQQLRIGFGSLRRKADAFGGQMDILLRHGDTGMAHEFRDFERRRPGFPETRAVRMPQRMNDKFGRKMCVANSGMIGVERFGLQMPVPAGKQPFAIGP